MLEKAGKTLTIFVMLTIILLLSSTCIGFYLYHMEQRKHKEVETQLDATMAQGVKFQSQIKDLQGQLALEEDKNKEADQKINNLLDEQDLNEGLRKALKKENADLQDQVDNLNQAKDKMKSDLDAAAAKLSQFQDLLKTSDDKSKDLENRLATASQQNRDLTSRLAAMSSPTERIVTENVPQGNGKTMELAKIVVNPPDAGQGHIVSVDTNADFVIFNLGMKQGLKPDDVLSVYRGNQYVGDIKAIRVQDEMSAADIIPPLTASGIQKDDTVVLKP